MNNKITVKEFIKKILFGNTVDMSKTVDLSDMRMAVSGKDKPESTDSIEDENETTGSDNVFIGSYRLQCWT